MTAVIIRGHQLQELAATLGIPPGEATMSRILANLSPTAAAAYAGRVKARQVRDQALVLAADDAARQQPENALDWEAVAGMLRSRAGGGIDPVTAARALLEGLE